MNAKITIAWRSSVAGLLAVTALMSTYWFDKWTQIDAETMLSVSVSIKTISHVRTDSVGDSVWVAAGGSGILISNENCEVLTNHHVVEEAAYIEVFPRHWVGSSGIPAKLINSNPRTDVAILKMSRCEGLAKAVFGNSDNVSAGDEVYAVGNPLGSNPDSISRGIVSHTKRLQNGGVPFFQIDANINHGNSGGALFNRSAEVIGMNTGLLASPSGQKFGIGYSLPINLVKQEAMNLRSGSPHWGDAGIEGMVQALSPEEASVFNVPEGHGAIIMTDDANEGPGKGKLYARDVIYKVNQTKVNNINQIKRLINSHTPGDRISFSLIRKGQALNVDIELVNGWKNADAPGAEYYEGYLGLSLEMWNDDDHEIHFNSPVITNVKSLSPSHLAHISSSQKTILGNGAVAIPVQLSVKTVIGVVVEGNYYPIKNIAELEQRAHQAYTANKPILLEIESWGRSQPMSLRKPLQRQKVAYHKILPELTKAITPIAGAHIIKGADSFAVNRRGPVPAF